MANILLVATGGTRAPTQIELAERFRADGHAIRTVASGNGLRFLGSYLARRPSKILGYIKYHRSAMRETLAYFVEKPKSVPHISEGKWADVVVMAPATCNSVGKLVAGVVLDCFFVAHFTPRICEVHRVVVAVQVLV